MSYPQKSHMKNGHVKVPRNIIVTNNECNAWKGQVTERSDMSE